MRTMIVVVQAVSFLALALVLLNAGDWRLGSAQVLFAVVTGLVYL